MICTGKHTACDSAYFKAPYLRQDIKSVFSVRLIYLNSGIDNISFPHEPFLIYPCSPADHFLKAASGNHSSNSHFSGNVAQRVLTGGWGDHGQGGAIWVHAPPDVSDPSQGAWIVNSVLSENVGLWGGGIHLNGGALWIYQSTITLNETGYQNSGGGISNWNGDLYLRNSIVWGNIDPGFYSPTVGQVSPHGYQCDSDTRVFAANTDIMVTGLSPADGCLRDCNDSGPVYGECMNPRHIAPSFVQAGGANADYHHSGAECAELGDNALLPPDWHDLDGDGDTSEPLPVDLDGQPRVVGTVDLGPYERQ